MVLCCICGRDINGPSEGGKCVQCLRREVDIVEGITRRAAIEQCGTCGKYLKPPWVRCEPESRELLGVCLRHIKGITREHNLVDANFIYTEPHSKELKVKLVLQKEAFAGIVLQQPVVVELRVNALQCPDCRKSFTKHTWESCVQVRQRVEHRRSLLHLEQLILQHKAHQRLIGLEHKKEGLDFFFSRHRDSEAFVAFVKAWSVAKVSESKQLISHNAASSTYRFKRTALLELCPVCRDDLVWLPPKTAQALGGLPSVMLCTRAVSFLRLVDPSSLRCVEVSAVDYWKRPFQPLLSRRQLQEFIILDVTDATPDFSAGPHSGRTSRMQACEVEVARAADFGYNDDRISVRSHLGAVLRPGETVLGFDFRTVNTAIDDEDLAHVPLEVYLVKLPKKQPRKHVEEVDVTSQSGRGKKARAHGARRQDKRQVLQSQQGDVPEPEASGDEEDSDDDEEARFDAAQMVAAAEAWLGSVGDDEDAARGVEWGPEEIAEEDLDGVNLGETQPQVLENTDDPDVSPGLQDGAIESAAQPAQLASRKHGKNRRREKLGDNNRESTEQE